MGLFDRLLRRKAVSPRGTGDLAAHRPALDAMRARTILLVASDRPGFSKLGGLPYLPEDLAWPEWKGLPLAFLAQIDLSEIPSDVELGPLPPTGALWCFYVADQGTWGFDPNDRGSFVILHRETTEGARRTAAPSALSPEGLFPEVPLTFEGALTYPDYEDPRIQALHLDDAQSDAYSDLCSSVFGGQPEHHLLGHPSPVQGNEMDLECQLATNGLYCGDATGFESPKRAALESGRSDWLLLLQIDSDDRAEMMWGDAGRLYFWIRKQDLARRDFSKVWMIMQCS